jgi:hypothetical protein
MAMMAITKKVVECIRAGSAGAAEQHLSPLEIEDAAALARGRLPKQRIFFLPN